jgi:hypothetical protein
MIMVSNETYFWAGRSPMSDLSLVQLSRYDSGSAALKDELNYVPTLSPHYCILFIYIILVI